jgi:synaptojanin
MSEFFGFENGNTPDVIVYGCQEYVDLNAMNMMSSDQSKSKIWIDFIDQALKMYGNYTYVRSQNLVGLLLIIFAKDSLWNRISKIEADTVKTGLAGTVGNKGAVVIKFNIDDTSFVFVNVHMEAGGKAIKERLANLSEFHNRAFQQNTGVGKRRVLMSYFN